MDFASDLFKISPTEIARLVDLQLVKLSNDLIWAEALKSAVPHDEVETSLRINDADGGVDARTDPRRGSGSLWLGKEPASWQFKKSWPNKAKLKNELEGEEVQQGFGRGFGYTLIVGQDMTPTTFRKRRDTLIQLAKEANCPGEVRLLDADHLARWTSSFPSLVLQFRESLTPYVRADEFLSIQPNHRVPFVADDERTQLIGEFQRKYLSISPASFKGRLNGLPGVGKSRFILEAAKASGMAGSVLYSQQVPTDIRLFSWVANNPSISVIVIVDECEDVDARRLEALAAQCEGRMILFTLGPGRGTDPDSYILKPIALPTMTAIIRGALPGLQEDQAFWIAEKSQGYVKLALAFARAIYRGSLSLDQLRDDRDIQAEISSLLTNDPTAQRVITAIALLTRVGFEGTLQDEGRCLAEFIGLGWNDFQFAILGSLKEGLVVQRGRHWYVSPELLAIWLSAEFWRHQPKRITELMNALPSPQSRDAFLDRLSMLDVASVQDSVVDLLGAQGPFREASDLEDQQSSRLFYVISKICPDEAMQALERLFAVLGPEQLREFTRGRRNVMWTLEMLLERRETFFDAARLTFRLAMAENETYGNNATETWSQLFLTRLGATEVPAIERLKLVDEALDTGTNDAIRLALRALKAALTDWESGRPMGGLAGVPRSRWAPTTWDEFKSVKQAALDRLALLIQNPSESIAIEAEDVFIGAFRSLVVDGLFDSAMKVTRTLSASSESRKRKEWIALRSTLKYEGSRLTESEREQLESQASVLYGESLLDRIKRYTGSHTGVDWPNPGSVGKRPDLVAVELAEELVTEAEYPLGLIEWMTSPDAVGIGPFAFKLGQIDRKASTLSLLVSATNDKAGQQALMSYVAGLTTWNPTRAEGTLDDLIGEGRGKLAFRCTVAMGATPRAMARILDLLNRQLLDSNDLNMLRYGMWIDGSNASFAKKILAYLDSSRDNDRGLALNILADWLREPTHEAFEVRPEALFWLEASTVESSDDMASYHWTLIATEFLETDAEKLAVMIVKMVLGERGVFGDERLSFLREQLIAIDPKGIWESIGQELLQAENSLWSTLALSEARIISAIPVEVVENWIQAAGEPGAHLVARLMNPLDSIPLTQFLLEHFHEASVGPLSANLISGSHWGPESQYLLTKIDNLAPLIVHESVALAEWAKAEIDWMYKRIREVKVYEEELFSPF